MSCWSWEGCARRRTKEAASRAVTLVRESGRTDLAAGCLLSLFGRAEYPSPEDIAAATLLAHALHDLHVLACGKTYKE